MMFEAILFLAGAVLFFLAVLFFVFLWQDRMALIHRRETLQVEAAGLKEQRVELDIREHELQVWGGGLEHQQKALEQAQEELRMLTASKQAPDPTFVVAPSGEVTASGEVAPRAIDGESSVLKNVKQKVKLE
jgi:hypothetical protein